MKFTCEKDALVSAISIAIRSVSPKSAITALEGVYMRAGNDLQLTGFNLETGVTIRVDAEIQDCGECVMPARLFFDIVRKMPDDTVTISVDDGLKVTLRSGIATFTIMAEDSSDYPELPDVEFTNGISIPQKALRELISGTLFASSQNPARPILTGCLIEVEENCITMVAVDGFRLAKRSFHTPEPTGRLLKFVVPADALRELEKILEDTEEKAVFTLGPRHILFEVGRVTLVSRILEGEFMDWRRVMPDYNPIKLCANVSALTASIERVSLIVSEKTKSPVRCIFGENVVDFRTVTTIGSAHDICSLSGDGKDLEIGFNCRYLLDALKVIPTGEVMLELSNHLSPVILTPCEGSGENFSYMVLPVRIKPGI